MLEENNRKKGRYFPFFFNHRYLQNLGQVCSNLVDGESQGWKIVSFCVPVGKAMVELYMYIIDIQINQMLLLHRS